MSLIRAEIDDRQTEVAQALGHERAMARLRIALDAKEGSRRVDRKLRHQRAEVDLTILEVTELGRWRELFHMPVSDACLGKRTLKPRRVRPSVVRPPHTAALAEVEQQPHVL